MELDLKNLTDAGDHICLLVAPSSEININIERLVIEPHFVHSPAYGCLLYNRWPGQR